MRGAVSKGGGNSSLADGILCGGEVSGSGAESEGFEEKYRAVIDWGIPLMNRSAKDGIRSSPHYGGEGVTHSPIAPRCLLAARYGRFVRDPRRPVGVLVLNQVSDPISESEMGSDAPTGVGERNLKDRSLLFVPAADILSQHAIYRSP